ncbi:MAG: hypothetical protein QGG09_05570, partial [Pirellulaceae bacterium]|nr:hypothetical protein [Pirellulaceae bacterium]
CKPTIASCHNLPGTLKLQESIGLTACHYGETARLHILSAIAVFRASLSLPLSVRQGQCSIIDNQENWQR